MMLWSLISDIAVVLSFVLLNAFFVASEFALVKVRLTQVEPMAHKGNRRALIARDILLRPTAYLSAAQLGVTMTSLGLGWVGEPLIASLLEPACRSIGMTSPELLHGVSFGVAFSIITAVHIIVGELGPKVLALQRPVPTLLTISYPFRVFFIVFRPLVLLLHAASNGLLRLIGLRIRIDNRSVESEEELRLLLSHDTHVTTISKNIALNAIDFRHKQARHAMVPRKEIIALSLAAPAEESMAVIRANKFSRYPVFRESIDNVVGMVVTKDIFRQERHHQPDFTLSTVLRDAVFLPETATLERTLETMLQKRTHLVVLADEYGGTAGIITLELVLEELVGTIQDEYDREAPEIMKVGEGEYLVDGSVTTNEIERLLDVELSRADIRSIGGYVVEQLGHFPKPGESFETEGLLFTAEKVVEHAVEQVRITRIPPAPEAEPAPAKRKRARSSGESNKPKDRNA